jgi:amidohydrolase
MQQRVREMATGVAAAHGATATVDFVSGFPALVNDPRTVARALRAARTIGFAADDILTLPVQGGGEDFAHYAQHVPAAFVFLGARNESAGCAFPHHHPHFNIDERALPAGTALLTQFALDEAEDDGE